MLLESAFHYLFYLKFSFKLVTFSKSYARKHKWMFFFWTQCIFIQLFAGDVQDNEDYDIKRHFPEAIAFLDDVKRSRGRSLVHCNLGVNRSGAVVAAYLMVSERRTLLDVIQYLRSKRSLVLSNKGFRRQLVTFARERRLLDPIISDDGSSTVSTLFRGSSKRGVRASAAPIKILPPASPMKFMITW